MNLLISYSIEKKLREPLSEKSSNKTECFEKSRLNRNLDNRPFPYPEAAPSLSHELRNDRSALVRSSHRGTSKMSEESKHDNPMFSQRGKYQNSLPSKN